MPLPDLHWRCYYCNEVFTDAESASEHFGAYDYAQYEPACIELSKTDVNTLIKLVREQRDEIRKLEDQLEVAELQLDHWQYFARKFTKKPSAHHSDVEMEIDYREGLRLAAEHHFNYLPEWIKRFIRWRTEQIWRKKHA